MQFDFSVRWKFWFQSLLFLCLLSLVIGSLAWLSIRYSVQSDWTAGGRNTLSESSRILLARLNEPVHITAYARENPALRDSISRLIERYRRLKANLTLTFINPDLLPDRVRELGVTLDGELYVEYRGRGEKVQQLSEQALTLALQRLHRQQQRNVLFLEGHGERKPSGIANYDLGTFGRELEKIGVSVQSLDLAKTRSVSNTATVLVIAGPQQPLAATEVVAILDYVEGGGNLLWLLEPDDPSGLQSLALGLGVTMLPGVIVDPDTSQLGIKNPTFIPIVDYGPHPITEALRTPALLPQAVALEIQAVADWKATVLLESQADSWTAMGPMNDGVAQLDAEAATQKGPFTVGIALFRPRSRAMTTRESEQESPLEQRIAVIGDGDFLSNTYLGNGANLALGLNLVNWLSLEENPIIVRPGMAPDQTLALSDQTLALLAMLFLVGISGGFLVGGWLIWFRRQRR